MAQCLTFLGGLSMNRWLSALALASSLAASAPTQFLLPNSPVTINPPGVNASIPYSIVPAAGINVVGLASTIDYSLELTFPPIFPFAGGTSLSQQPGTATEFV